MFMGISSRLLIKVLRNGTLHATIRGIPRRKIRRFVWMLFRLLATRKTMGVRRRGLIILRLVRSIRGNVYPILGTLSTLRYLNNVLSRSPVRRIMSVLRIMMRNRAIRTTILNSVVSNSLVRQLLGRRLFRQYLRHPFYDL